GQPQYGQPQYGQPQYGQQPQPGYGQPYGGPAGFRPTPTQRGVVPLRPLSLGEIFDGAFKSIRSNPRVMFGFSAIVVSLTVLVQTLIEWALIGPISSAFSDATSNLDPTGQAGLADSFGFSGGMLVTAPLMVIATTVLTGVLIVSVSRSVIGEKVGLGELWRLSWRRILVLVGLTIAVAIAELALLAAVVAAVWALAVSNQVGLAVLLGLVALVVFVVGAIWFQVRTLLIPAALVLEGTRVTEAVGRGWRLTRGSFWRLLGIYLLAAVLVGFLSQVVAWPTTIIATIVDPTFSTPAPLAITAVGTAVASTLGAVFQSAVVALLYIDVRIRREGLDVELARAAEAAATGQPSDA
ncbi:MAG: hypothetical protein HGA44_21000, partial [Cellulomonadaceae bacterium]|nr:hypothetical protein [Cellulomonadaceae bacterium]